MRPNEEKEDEIGRDRAKMTRRIESCNSANVANVMPLGERRPLK
jgi:hypothetical protein